MNHFYKKKIGLPRQLTNIHFWLLGSFLHCPCIPHLAHLLGSVIIGQRSTNDKESHIGNKLVDRTRKLLKKV